MLYEAIGHADHPVPPDHMITRRIAPNYSILLQWYCVTKPLYFHPIWKYGSIYLQGENSTNLPVLCSPSGPK